MGLLPGSNQEHIGHIPVERPEGGGPFQGDEVRMVTRIYYIGGFIGDQELEKEWLVDNVTGWTDSVEVLAGIDLRHLLTAYVVM